MLGIPENEITSLVNKIVNDNDTLVNTTPIVWKAYIDRSPLYKEEYVFHFEFERKHILCHLLRTPFSDTTPEGRNLYLSENKNTQTATNPFLLLNTPSLEEINNFLSAYWNFEAPTDCDLVDYGIREKYRNEFERSDIFNLLLENYNNSNIDDVKIEKIIENESTELVGKFENALQEYSNNTDAYDLIMAHKEYLKQLKYSYLRTHNEKYRNKLATKHPAWIINYGINIASFLDYVWQVEENDFILICKIKIEELYRIKIFYYIGGVNFIVKANDAIFDFSGLDWDLSIDRLYLNFHSDKSLMHRFINLIPK